MKEARVVEIQTPKNYVLNGLWFGKPRARTVHIWVHGLGSSVFSKLDIMELLAKGDTAVLAFNNRGHDKLSSVRQNTGKTPKAKLAGGGAEVFTECADDIEGAVRFARSQGAKSIFLVGHSTGCQKSVYWAAQKGRGVKGIILLAPISDYAGAIARYGKAKIAKVSAYARALVSRGKQHELIPLSIWSEEVDTAQRFLSLYSPDSVEEIFTYSQNDTVPRTLKRVKVPILCLLAENDEFGDRPAGELAVWFKKQLKKDDEVHVIPAVTHGFKGAEHDIANRIKRFARS